MHLTAFRQINKKKVMYLKLCNDYELIIEIAMTSDNRIIIIIKLPKWHEKMKACHKKSF